jgi:hypothetical protein
MRVRFGVMRVVFGVQIAVFALRIVGRVIALALLLR